MQTETTKPEDLSQKIIDLENRRRSVDFAYQNSPWASGPRYRAQLDQIDRELSELRKVAA
jgi:hypothetical protein